MERLVNPQNGIGMNLMRICIGTPDFTGDPWHSYHDLPPGETDPPFAHFPIEKDRAYILPVIKQALRRIRPAVLRLAVEPAGLDEEDGQHDRRAERPGEPRAADARYFVRFVRAYEAGGCPSTPSRFRPTRR